MTRNHSKNPFVMFDLDHTLFNTTELKKDIFSVLNSCGGNKNTIMQSFDSFIKSHEGNYDILSHSKELLESGYINSLENVYAFLSSSLDKHLVGGSKEVLAELRKKGHHLILITKGIEQFQYFKIRNSGIESFFDEIHIVQNFKEDILKNLDPPEGSFFINDHAIETERIMHAHPLLRYIIFSNPKDSPYAPSSSYKSIPVINNLRNILDII
ncbi:MAG: HAD hydrolase-like protein [Patescibacteria group bacterium]|nr:HAD hydrolase-like protein [Patescibacteria group bacterium]